MSDTQPKFCIFRTHDKAFNHAFKLSIDTNEPHCLWTIGRYGYLVAVKGFDPRKTAPSGIGVLKKIHTIKVTA